MEDMEDMEDRVTALLSDLDTGRPRGRAASGSQLQSHCAIPGAPGRTLLLPWARDSCSSGSGSPIQPHRSWCRGSSPTTGTSPLALVRGITPSGSDLQRWGLCVYGCVPHQGRALWSSSASLSHRC